jgi:hypothetical protein
MRDKVTIYLQTSDKTRKAEVTVPRDMLVADLVRTGSKRWFMSTRVDYQVVNINSGRQLLSSDMLTTDNVRHGDTLMIQAFPTHGRE